MTDQSEALAKKLNPLRPLVNRTATVYFNANNTFAWCLASSFVKAFEFVELTTKSEHGDALFIASSLRSITEELIILNYLYGFPDEDRNNIVTRLMQLEVGESIKYQNAFFRSFRPFQPVLQRKFNEEERLKEELRDIWRSNGWPNFNKTSLPIIPPTREIAQKSEKGLLEVVYDFIYRLSSSSVHFRPMKLLRMGWGDIDNTATFSSKNVGGYYQAINQIYGAFLLCLYLELFDEFLKSTKDEKESLKELREYLLDIFRWPEMVTFEEMNLDVPDSKVEKWPNFLIFALYTVMLKDGFISGAKEILGASDAQRQRTADETSES